MHVLGRHSFSQRRKSTKRPRDLQIRKISLSGCSLCSDDSSTTTTTSSSSSSAAAAAPTTVSPRTPVATSPVAGNASPSHAPARLSERRFIRPAAGTLLMPRQRHTEPLMTFFDDRCEDDETPMAGFQLPRQAQSEDGDDKEKQGFFDFHFESDEGEEEGEEEELVTSVEELPPFPRRTDDEVEAHDEDEERVCEAPDYFFTRKMLQRPTMLRSRWSESTIQTLDTLDTDAEAELEEPVTPTTEVSFGTEDQHHPLRAVSAASISSGRATTFGYERQPSQSTTTETDEEEEEEEEPHPHPHPQQREEDSDDAVTPSPAVEAIATATAVTIVAPSPKRPPMPAMDAVESFIKRGGWKRRGIVFHQEELYADDHDPHPDQCEGCTG